MDKQIVVRLHASFEDMMQKDSDTGTEFWNARDLQMLLGYARWENFDLGVKALLYSGLGEKGRILTNLIKVKP